MPRCCWGADVRKKYFINLLAPQMPHFVKLWYRIQQLSNEMSCIGITSRRRRGKKVEENGKNEENIDHAL